MTAPNLNINLIRAHASVALLVLLQDIGRAMQAFVLGDLQTSESCARNALLFSAGEQQYLLNCYEPSYRKQMHYVATGLQKLVSAAGKKDLFPAALLEAAIAIVDAETVIAGQPPSKKMLDLRAKISESYLALPKEALV